MVKILARYHRNHRSMYLKYDVLGNVILIELKSDAKTSNAVTVPMNLSLKSLMLIKRVE